MGVQFQNGYSTVDGNYGFGDGCFTGDVSTSTPRPPATARRAPAATSRRCRVHRTTWCTSSSRTTPYGKPLYKFTREEDINIGNGDEFVAPQVPPPACAGALHTVDVAGHRHRRLRPGRPRRPRRDRAASTPTDNPTLRRHRRLAVRGHAEAVCDTKLVPLANGKSIAPTFNVFTDVPLPGHFWGLLVDDLNFSSDPHQINFGEKAGVPFAPVGIYDYTNRLVYTAESDYSGLFDVLLPSTNRINCPTPSGVCANVYRFVGNDPGVPGQLNPNYKPEYRTIAAEFEAIAGQHRSRPTWRRPRSGSPCSCPAARPSTVECAQPQPCRSSSPCRSRT